MLQRTALRCLNTLQVQEPLTEQVQHKRQEYDRFNSQPRHGCLIGSERWVLEMLGVDCRRGGSKRREHEW